MIARVTETEMRELIAKRYPGPEYVVLPGVRSATGAGAARTADAIAMSPWPSRGLAIHGFEIKVSRNDMLRELANPEKAEAVAEYCNYWWIVASDPRVVQPEEVPALWGLYVKDGSALRLVKDAAQRPPRAPTTEFLASILRAAYEHMPSKKEIDKRIREARDSAFEDGVKSAERESAWKKERDDRMRERVDLIMQVTGLSEITIANRDPKELAAAIRFALEHRHDFRSVRRRALDIVASCDEVLANEPGLSTDKSTPDSQSVHTGRSEDSSTA